VGKTVVSALLCRAAIRARSGAPVAYWKPVQTGPESDTAEVARLLTDLEDAVRLETPLHAYPLPASPDQAAAAAGGRIDVPALARRLSELAAGSPGGLLVLEPAGGLLVPYDETHTQADLLAAQGPEIVLVARSGLGTLNHALLTLEALVARGLQPGALVLVGPPHAENRATLARRSGIEAVFELPPLAPLDGAALDRWLDRSPDGRALDAWMATRLPAASAPAPGASRAPVGTP
jgi:dethiobiotin synthase